MEDSLNILPCTFKPEPDELFSSWLVRLAYAHGSKTHTFYKILFPNIHIWNRDIDQSATDELIDQLTLITPYSFKTIFDTTLRSYEGKLYLNHNSNGINKWLLPLGVYHRKRKNQGLLFCPKCLERDQDNPYFRKHWRLSFLVVCTKCGIYLHDKCPRCQKPVVFFRKDLGKKNKIAEDFISFCFHCNFNLATSEVKYAPVKLLRSQRMLMRILREGWKSDVFFPHLYFDVLHQVLKIIKKKSISNLPLQKDLSKRIRILPALPDHLPAKRSFELSPLSHRIILIYQALWLLGDFPERFIKVLRYHELKSSSILHDSENCPFWFEHIIHENFYINNTNRRFIYKQIKIRKGHNSVVAPLKGLVGGKRKLSESGFFCPRCASNWIILDGKRNGIQRYKCRTCGNRILAEIIILSSVALHQKKEHINKELIVLSEIKLKK